MTNDININLTNCIGPAYYDIFHDMEQRKNVHYWFKGGRGSLKSSYAHIYAIWDLTRDYLAGKHTHAVGLRKIKDTIKDSVFTNFLWAIDVLNVGQFWNYTTIL